MNEKRDWLVLSLKWSAGDDQLVWYRANARGYTRNLRDAGRYTRTEAVCHELEGVTLAVPEVAALRHIEPVLFVRKDAAVIESLRAESAKLRGAGTGGEG